MKIDGSSGSTWPRPTSSVSASRTPTIRSVSVSSSTAEVVASTRSTRPTSPAFVTTAMPLRTPSWLPLSIVMTSSSKFPTPPRTTDAVTRPRSGRMSTPVAAQPVELCSLGLDRQLVAFELLNSLGEQPVLCFEIVIVKDGVPRIGERRDDCARHLGDRVQKVADKSLRCSERAEAAEIKREQGDRRQHQQDHAVSGFPDGALGQRHRATTRARPSSGPHRAALRTPPAPGPSRSRPRTADLRRSGSACRFRHEGDRRCP